MLVQPQIVAIGTVLEQYRHCVGRAGQVRLGMAGGVDTSEWVAVVCTMSEWSLSCLVQYAIHVHECSCRMKWSTYRGRGLFTSVHVHVHLFIHEQSYYIVHYIRRKEGKEGRKQRTNTDNLQQPQHVHV